MREAICIVSFVSYAFDFLLVDFFLHFLYRKVVTMCILVSHERNLYTYAFLFFLLLLLVSEADRSYLNKFI